MRYRLMKIWFHAVTGRSWYSLTSYKGGGIVDDVVLTEASSDTSLQKTIAWAESQGMTIEDARAPAAEIAS